ncbi:ComEC/Rec2 family competence protein [Candidatus Sulfurimonas marisnigri]|uniref:ComEC/Rec2 family competence protein n=1 Tax=Candidatus Sulfurimonas marisnigri TaxID=2740405 RepID=A0A7S7RQV8_9BACT|nr:ComEC/Rec2 family competence protein [Candidatus Sulfurimonas marisnigri]QOY54973.1 ComEC/Rec2 family competence protein [Candidatus Sulfurimonas marisnigri]
MIERVSLFNTKREFLLFLLTCTLVLFYSLLIEYQNYKQLTRFDSQIVSAAVIKQYEKIKNGKTFQVLKLKSEEGFIFYSSAKKSFEHVEGKKLKLEIFAGKINFYEYLTSFYAYSKVKYIDRTPTLKQELNTYISSIHTSENSNSSHVDKNIANIYQALYTATPLNKELQSIFSTLGVSHLLAISGFHLGVLSALLFFLLKPIYSYFQNRYFPYRNSKFDIFIIVSLALLTYLLFLDSPPSLLRAFAMLIIGFILYDRGIKIVSMQTLLLTVLLLLSFFPKLFFALGFWLSVSGVFYIFLFLIHFKDLNKIWQFIIIPFWVYILMLPFSLTIFGNFSIYHPLSIVWTTLFTLFYPLSILLHVVGYADAFDGLLESLIFLGQEGLHVELSYKLLALHVVISLLSIYKKSFVWLMLVFSFFVFIYAVYHVA